MMQTFVKKFYQGVKVSGIPANRIVFQFARMNARPRKTLEEMLNENKEVQEAKKQTEAELADEDVLREVKRQEFLHNMRRNIEVIDQEEPNQELMEQEEGETSLDVNNQFGEFDKETKKFIKDELLYAGYDPHPEKLVQRPYKDVVWGLGGQLLRRKTKFFEKGRVPDIEEIIAFLEMEQAKDVTLTDMDELGRTDLPRYGIVLSGYSSRHLYRMATALLKSIKEIEIPGLINPPRIDGRRDDEWIMVSWKDVMVHMFTEEARGDLNMEQKWTAPEEDYEGEEDDLSLMEKMRERRKAYQGYKGEEF